MLKSGFWLTLHCETTCMVQDTRFSGHKVWSRERKFNVCSLPQPWSPMLWFFKLHGGFIQHFGPAWNLTAVGWFGIHFMFPRGWILLTWMIPLMADQRIPWGWCCYFPALRQITMKPFIYSSQRIIQNDFCDLLTYCITFIDLLCSVLSHTVNCGKHSNSMHS